jgi:hypothetical protein
MAILFGTSDSCRNFCDEQAAVLKGPNLEEFLFVAGLTDALEALKSLVSQANFSDVPQFLEGGGGLVDTIQSSVE